MPGEQSVDRTSTTKRFLDKRRNPWEYVDEELPTTTIKRGLPEKVGRARAPHGTAIGSYRITGSHYDFSPGTYSLRVTRLSVACGSREACWAIRHSRTGTADIIYFPAAGQETRLGNPLAPVYAFGPGTVMWQFLDVGSAYWMSSHIEGVI